jgi:hypothetical protein
MKHGDPLYTIVEDGQLEKYTFIEESIVQGATVSTWLVKDADGGLHRCSTDMYETTEKAAWKKYLSELESALRCYRVEMNEVFKNIEHIQHEMIKTMDTISGL